MRPLRRQISAVALTWSGALVLASGCMLITSPGNFSIVDASVGTPEGGGACASLAAGSKCEQCVGASCCESFTACKNSPACVALTQCDPGDTSCMDDNASGMSALNAYSQCTTESCSICLEASIGDPCTEVCDKGTCNGIFCSQPCTTDADCNGSGQDGENMTGGQNRCAVDSEMGTICFPGCNTSTDCSEYPGTICEPASAANGGTTNVCAAADGSASSDGGDDDAGDDTSDDSSSSSGGEESDAAGDGNASDGATGESSDGS